MSRTLDDLSPLFKPKAMELLARLTEAGIMVCIVDTLRTEDEQRAAVARGVSQVEHSRHQDGMAMDICPYLTWALHGTDKLQWDTTDAAWLTIGRIAEGLGLRWGGRFRPLNAAGIGWDAGHVEMPEVELDRV